MAVAYYRLHHVRGGWLIQRQTHKRDEYLTKAGQWSLYRAPVLFGTALTASIALKEKLTAESYKGMKHSHHRMATVFNK